MTIVQTTRTHAEVALGVSTRGALTYFKACQALAMVSGRDFVIPEDVKRLAVPVLSHRILMKDRRMHARRLRAGSAIHPADRERDCGSEVRSER